MAEEEEIQAEMGYPGPQGENTGRAGERWMWHWTSQAIQS